MSEQSYTGAGQIWVKRTSFTSSKLWSLPVLLTFSEDTLPVLGQWTIFSYLLGLRSSLLTLFWLVSQLSRNAYGSICVWACVPHKVCTFHLFNTLSLHKTWLHLNSIWLVTTLGNNIYLESNKYPCFAQRPQNIERKESQERKRSTCSYLTEAETSPSKSISAPVLLKS